jgi:hypothetical protein
MRAEVPVLSIRRTYAPVLGPFMALACNLTPGGGGFGGGTEATDDGGTSDETSLTAADGTGPGDDGHGVKYDVGSGDPPPDLPPAPSCKVVDGMNAVGECEKKAPPDSFEPVVQWTYGASEDAPEGLLTSAVTPLVANLTDDNGDGVIDLCDTPDVVFVAGGGYNSVCEIHVLDGATGKPHFVIPKEELVTCYTTPALGDIDGDGFVDIVTTWVDASTNPYAPTFRLKAFGHDGKVKWVNTTDGDAASARKTVAAVQGRQTGAIALHDLDADGTVEIVFNHEVYDHEGKLLWEHAYKGTVGEGEASVGVDLDGDGLMEVVTGHAAYRHDGTVYWDLYPTISEVSIPQILDADGDGMPEVWVTAHEGLFMLSHDGTILWGPVTPTGVGTGGNTEAWARPGTVHDLDGDGIPEFASSSREWYAAYRGPLASDILWKAKVEDFTGSAAGTAFDFLGDGVAEAMYADEKTLRVYDGKTGDVVLEVPRSSSTLFEYPVVADIDNDGSAEILVVSNPYALFWKNYGIQAIRDVDDRWIQARRIWNQHAYYVTNVREDGTIPQVPVNNWETLNTYRTNAQIEGGKLCQPPPAG